MSETKRLKRGDTREDGMVFWRYSVAARDGVMWMTPDKFNRALNLSYKANQRFDETNRGRGAAHLNLDPQQALAHHTNRLKIWREKRKAKITETQNEVRYKPGHVRDDGMVFLRYGYCSRGGIHWVTPEEFKRQCDKPKRRRKEDHKYRITLNLRCRLNNALKAVHSGKKYPRAADAPTIQWLLWLADHQGIDHKTHHIDHLRPARCFDLTTAEGQRAFNALENTWWLPATDNLTKNDSDPTEQQLLVHKELLAEYYKCKAYTSKVSPA